jgi:hypothetical protein
MKKFFFALLALLLLITGTGPLFAADAPSKNPAQIFESALPEIGARGIFFQENFSGMDTIGYIRYSHIPNFKSDGTVDPSDWWDWQLCNSWEDGNCPLKSGYTVEGRAFLGKCKISIEIGCIENLKATSVNGVQKELQYIGPALESIVDTPESRLFNIPRSSTPSLFQDENSNLYLVRAQVFYSLTGTSSIAPKLDADVYPVLKVSDSTVQAPERIIVRSPETGLNVATLSNTRSDCLAISTGICYKQGATNLENEYSLTLRLPKTITGWFKGRLKSPSISVKPFSDTSNLLTVSAKSVAMPVMGGWVKYDDLPSDFIKKLYPFGGYPTRRDQNLGLYADASQGDRAFEEFSAWAPYLKDKALTTIDIWSFGTNINPAKSRCMEGTTAIGGLVTTNASVYSSDPPTWNAEAMTLDYKIAAPHFNEAGVENVGSYTLAISNEVIQCLYGMSELPATARVSIVYGDTTTDVGTVAVGSKDGWSYFSVDGFHYSTPTIRVKFEKPTPIVTPAPTPTPTAGSTVQLAQRKKVIWCAKGNAKRKITALNPTCPKGYKKIADPTSR